MDDVPAASFSSFYIKMSSLESSDALGYNILSYGDISINVSDFFLSGDKRLSHEKNIFCFLQLCIFNVKILVKFTIPTWIS